MTQRWKALWACRPNSLQVQSCDVHKYRVINCAGPFSWNSGRKRTHTNASPVSNLCVVERVFVFEDITDRNPTFKSINSTTLFPISSIDRLTLSCSQVVLYNHFTPYIILYVDLVPFIVHKERYKLGNSDHVKPLTLTAGLSSNGVIRILSIPLPFVIVLIQLPNKG
jgi:hypothetical protein